ncbi:putative RecB family exonuclease [Haloactinopolyspora alba]|uniref:Putative RecB family exonuclease n=1 Tax=Haloactinopolyspora alba TaxID=648780 RepID=A0A2P8D9I1_9ACTN|nr:PD-(D/E)XK nuclease family protein [Haloactinopolyspora alba]PSK93841.1 putative RecB family exonuclease [Haloactinopolyspora alba]
MTARAGTGTDGDEAGTEAGSRTGTEPGSETGTGQATAVPTLSPSRAADFMTCPLLYRFRTVDRLPEPPSPEATRGTVVHGVLERLFDLPADQRTPDQAAQMVRPEWDSLLEADPAVAELFADDTDGSALAGWLRSAEELVHRYFTLEDPQHLEPAERELYVETTLDSGLRLRGYVDRLDRAAATGELRVVDYKTGRAPRAGFEQRAMFQMRFYALVLWRLRGTVPRLLQLIYLGSGEVLRYEPDEADLRATERKLAALWRAIQRAGDTGDWRPSPSRLCDWCHHQALCPSYGGTPPPLPVRAGGDGDDEAPSPRTSPVDA